MDGDMMGKKGDTIRTPIKRRRSLSEAPYSPKNRQRGGSGSSSEDSGNDVAVATNSDLIVSLRETLTGENQRPIFLLSISNSRSDTILGKVQGDHVTAYQAFLEMLIIASEGYDIREVTTTIAKIAKAIMPNKENLFDDLLNDISNKEKESLSHHERREVVAVLKNLVSKEILAKTQKDLIAGKRKIYMEAVEKMAQTFIEEINLDDNIAFKKMGPSDGAEGAKIRVATHALKAASALTHLINDSTTRAENHFYDDYIKVRAPYKDGANALFGKDNIIDIHKNQDKTKIDWTDLYGLIKEEKIAEFFGTMFDFKYDNHFREDIDVLYEVVAKHLIIMFNAFENLKKRDTDHIIDLFLKKQVLENSGWKNHLTSSNNNQDAKITLGNSIFFAPDEHVILKHGITRHANLREFRMLSEKEIVRQLYLGKI